MLIDVEWETDGEPIPVPNPVWVPPDIYEEGMTSWGDPVSEWLSDNYSYLVQDWRLHATQS